MTFLERLASGPPILTDGGTGTERRRTGAGALDVHRAFVDAGAELVVADSITLAGLAHTEPDRAADEMSAAVSQARAAGATFVAASLGPSAPRVEDAGRRIEVYRRLAEAAKRSGADVLFAETLLTSFDADAALAAAQKLALPVAVSFPFRASGRGYGGLAPERLQAWAESTGPDAAGVNCGDEPEHALDALLRWHGSGPRSARVPLVFRPAAGNASESAFAEVVSKAVAMRARIVGGCCGATPAHIAAIATRLDRWNHWRDG